MMNLAPELIERMKRIKMILLDVDGVLTDGGIILGNEGEEIKKFDIQDGMGVTLARMAGMKVGIITGRQSSLVERRAKELNMDVVMQGFFHKLPAYQEILRSYPFEENEICYMGDDFLDLEVLERVGLAVTPANGRPQIKAMAHFVTQASGGKGAVRELVDTIITAKGMWDEVVEKCRMPKGN
jgi:3-deoxy-D-manno-octulosonate 8-phosphate phosphatase (KDO 8-P phosphatase)